MAEHFRKKDYAGNLYQWADCELCMILDSVTGEPQRFGKFMNSIGTLEEAKKHCFISPDGPNRNVIVILNGIKEYQIDD